MDAFQFLSKGGCADSWSFEGKKMFLLTRQLVKLGQMIKSRKQPAKAVARLK
ncbi:hypothetical protein BJX65DRAFT_286276 [Aspergillus insuetus]